eukprot:gene12752-15593_t
MSCEPTTTPTPCNSCHHTCCSNEPKPGQRFLAGKVKPQWSDFQNSGIQGVISFPFTLPNAPVSIVASTTDNLGGGEGIWRMCGTSSPYNVTTKNFRIFIRRDAGLTPSTPVTPAAATAEDEMFSLVTRRSTILSQISSYITRAEPKGKAAAGGKGKGKPGAAKKKRFERASPDPLDLGKVNTQLFQVDLPQKESDYPSWLYKINDQLPRDKPVRLLTPADGSRYFKQQSRLKIKANNEIMKMTRGRGL